MCGVGESSPAFGNVPYPLIFDSIAKNDTTTKVIMSLTKHMKITKGKKRRRVRTPILTSGILHL